MKIQVTGDSAAAGTLRQHLESLGFQLVNEAADYVVRMEEGAQPGVVISGTPGTLADSARQLVGELASGPVTGNETIPERGLQVVASACHAEAAVRGVLRALLQLAAHGVEKNWLQKLFS